MTPGPIDQEKQAVRERVWTLLDEAKAVPPDSYGKIPGFFGAEQTAERLAKLDIWKRARTIKSNPDYAQLPIRARALEDGKLLYMAVPKIAGLKPFFRIDPSELDVPAVQAAEKATASKSAKRVGIDEMTPIDMVICGSVAVNRSGARIGKGAGYSDIEVALLIAAGLVTEETTIVATVHQLQVIEEGIPETTHDFSVDVIVTPEEVVECGNRRRPGGIVWGEMPKEKIQAIPVLKDREVG
ncbi:5-formyltetrahydrofolate cyclo-ligase [Stackebrandtia nassauensis]|uniref:5-formyltetrahydrofolate cyclo-ligase n=1 Tax=Stackebrandtia nassauensis (strain DSM 44728 / CIP 108903 / NRRL B-16338 / NBRC 102104 / LLR-40K-21) TaxID=446470 RepID=D3Q0G5_STANL|nr:5-formyltetrahydrofolate cyclo-ligase [Stackebrandtia nassauensis]ADD41701.1 5-formyltetrahydrofolate cyclo-ligase [Stackebrandtia nassauensis DSM 44728]